MRPTLLIILAVPIGAYIWRGMRLSEWGWGLVGFAIGAGFGFALWRALATGYVRNNLGEFPRAVRPLGYWLSVIVLILGYLMGIAGMIFAEYDIKQ